jgi:hypothetical protein
MTEIIWTSRLAPIRAQRKRLAACVAGLLCLAPAAHASNLIVTSCTDAGAGDTGNLRNTIAAANEGDSVDATGLTACPNSKITLSLGQITVARNNLTVSGPPPAGPSLNSAPLTIDGAGNSNHGMFRHSGAGTLNLYNLRLANGTVYDATLLAAGGCVYSAGSVNARGLTVYNCTATTKTGKAYGGGIYTKGQLTASYSTISHNTATAGSHGAQGGGFFSKGAVAISYSAVTDNIQTTTTSYPGCCGGGYSPASTTIQSSTISGNSAHRTGGLGVNSTSATLTIESSTISGNIATIGTIGGVSSYSGSTKVYYSTIAFNTAALRNVGAGPSYGGGLAVRNGTFSMANTIVANNSFGTYLTQSDLTVTGTATLQTFHNNLVRASPATLPPDTIRNQCPLLGPLRDNGGLTQTHALLGHSPAIDKGAFTTGPNEDQRGKPADTTPYPFPRKSGTAPDIGAFELQRGDKVFDSDFEGCP